MNTAPELPENDTRKLLCQLTAWCILPLVAVSILDWYLLVPLAQSDTLSNSQSITLILLSKVFLLPLIIVRMLRISDRHFQKHGNGSIRLMLSGALVIIVLAVVIGTVESVQKVIFSAASRDARVEKIPVYRFEFDSEEALYRIEGEIDFGISRDFRQFLLNHPGGRILLLNSPGGSIYEGRGIFQLVNTNKLDTRVEQECNSACALAFLGGNHRSLGANARLGFHQYHLDTTNLNQALPFYDPVAEQQRDIDLMRGMGIAESFLQRAFEQPHESIWYPPAELLMTSGVVHRIDD